MSDKGTIALVTVASRFESGGQRAEELQAGAARALEGRGFDVVPAPRVVWDAADALEAADRMAEAAPDLLVVIHATWVLDSLQYLFVGNPGCPVLLWAVPYTETFSIGCVQHFGSILRQRGLAYGHAYGLPGDRGTVDRIEHFAAAARAHREVMDARVALIGPRQTWRAAGSQDMTAEEWDLSETFGSTIVHVEMDELLGLAAAEKEAEARATLAAMGAKGRLGRVEVEESRLLHAARVYRAALRLFERYGLTAAAAECYPQYGGLANLPASWLADDGLVLDTEGDLGHTLMMVALNELAGAGATALAEIGSIDEVGNCLLVAHEGSGAHSLAAAQDEVSILPGGETGTVVGFPLRPMSCVTVCNVCGVGGDYRLSVLVGGTEAVSRKEWVDGGSKFMARVRTVTPVWDAVGRMLSEGTDHHLLIREGDLASGLADFAALFGLETVRL